MNAYDDYLEMLEDEYQREREQAEMKSASRSPLGALFDAADAANRRAARKREENQ